MNCCFCTILSTLLLLYVFYQLLKALYNILFPYFIASPINLRSTAGGKWAVITGSTDGIGKGYAFELANHGFSIVLISRSSIKLNTVKQEILLKLPKIEVKTIVFDFTCADVDEYKHKIFNELDKLDIGILVNNVGGIVDYPDVYHKTPGGLRKVAEINFINMLSTMMLCGSVLPQMVERNSGIIVNVSSIAYYKPERFNSVYAPSKTFVTRFTETLQLDYSDTNIIIQWVYPFTVITKLTVVLEKYYPSKFNVKVEDYVRNAVRSIGIVSETTGCPMHQLQFEFIRCLPDWLVNRYFDKFMHEFREKTLQYRAKEGKKE